MLSACKIFISLKENEPMVILHLMKQAEIEYPNEWLSEFGKKQCVNFAENFKWNMDNITHIVTLCKQAAVDTAELALASAIKRDVKVQRGIEIKSEITGLTYPGPSWTVDKHLSNKNTWTESEHQAVSTLLWLFGDVVGDEMNRFPDKNIPPSKTGEIMEIVFVVDEKLVMHDPMFECMWQSDTLQSFLQLKDEYQKRKLIVKTSYLVPGDSFQPLPQQAMQLMQALQFVRREKRELEKKVTELETKNELRGQMKYLHLTDQTDSMEE